MLRIAHGDVPRDALVESELREQAVGRGQALLAVWSSQKDCGVHCS